MWPEAPFAAVPRFGRYQMNSGLVLDTVNQALLTHYVGLPPSIAALRKVHSFVLLSASRRLRLLTEEEQGRTSPLLSR